MSKICDECETVAHCTKHGCVPKQQALDKMAENARELGLDYEPAQQEPVAAECNFVGTKEWGRCSIEHHNLVQSEPHKWPGYQTRLLYTSPQPAQQQERLTKAEQRMVHDFPHLAQFHAKHALGPMLPPSCLCCGHQTNPITHPVAVQHMELPGVVICKSCHDAALAQPQQEPVAFPTRRSVEREIERTANPTGMHLNDGKERVTLPGGTLRHMLALIDRTSPPAQRTWVGLTDKEIENLWHEFHDREFGWARRFTRAIEAKLKEKNNGN